VKGEMADFVIDSSVLVASLIPSDEFFRNGVSVVRKVLTRQKIACASVIVPVEVCSAIVRRTGDTDNAREARMQLQKWARLGLLELVDLNKRRMDKAQELAIKYSIKGMDAVIVQVADERSLPILTFDKELETKISGPIRTITDEDL